MIKKTSETTPNNSAVVNAQSNSTTDAYSCDYSNKAFGGTILWTNPNWTSSFTSQNITLSSGDYDMLMVIYSQNNASRRLMSQIAPKGETIRLLNLGYGGSPQVMFRNIDYSNSTTLSAGNCSENGSTSNADIIPLYIIGYKTGLFN